MIAELLRRCPWMELVEIEAKTLQGLKMRDGLSSWAILDDEGETVNISNTLPKLPGLKISHIAPKQRITIDEECDAARETHIASKLRLTKRLYHMDNDTGGFFVALLKHREDATPEGVARVYVPKRKLSSDSGWQPRELTAKTGGKHAVLPATNTAITSVVDQYQLNTSGLCWWQRGRRLNITPQSVYDRIYHTK